MNVRIRSFYKMNKLTEKNNAGRAYWLRTKQNQLMLKWIGFNLNLLSSLTPDRHHLSAVFVSELFCFYLNSAILVQPS